MQILQIRSPLLYVHPSPSLMGLAAVFKYLLILAEFLASNENEIKYENDSINNARANISLTTCEARDKLNVRVCE